MVEGERGEEAVKMDRDFLRAGSVNDGEEVGLGCEWKGGEQDESRCVRGSAGQLMDKGGIDDDVGAVSGSKGSAGGGRVGRGGKSSNESSGSGQRDRPSDRAAGVSSD